ncbi:MAG: ATP-binding protein [Candidatus Nanopelagicales bacterium]
MDVTVTLAADPRSAGVARRMLRDHLALARTAAAADDLADDLADDAAVVLSELVGNAVRHARGPIRVTLRSIGSGLRLEVRDAAPDSPPQPRPADGEATGGRGMHLVHGLSTRWGWDTDAAGKTVWAELG